MEHKGQGGAVREAAGFWVCATVRFRDPLVVRLPDIRDRAVRTQDIAPFGHFTAVRVQQVVIVGVL
jgi:hypothetical protein